MEDQGSSASKGSGGLFIYQVLDLYELRDELKTVLETSFFLEGDGHITFREYCKEDKKISIKKLMRAPKMTPSLSRELDRLIRWVHLKSTFETSNLVEALNYVGSSVRLENALRAANARGELPLLSVGCLLQDRDLGVAKLLKLPNIGKASLKDFVQQLDEFASELNNPFYKTTPIQDFLSLPKTMLSDRELDVLLRRVGYEQVKNETLEEIAKSYGVTRERVRQIEAKALKKLRESSNIDKIEPYLDELYTSMKNIIMHEKHFILSGQLKFLEHQVYSKAPYSKLLVKIVNEDLAGWMSNNFREIKSGGEIVGWINYRIPKVELQNLIDWMKSKSVSTNTWEDILLEAVYASNWPVNTYDLAKEFPNLSRSEIESFLVGKLGAKIDDNGIIGKMKMLSPVHRMVYILRDAKKELHISDVRLRHLKMFGEDQSEHAIGATLGRMDEALIVERGVYDLYENLNFTTDEIRSIADKIYRYIEEKTCYVSMKLVYKELFTGSAQYLGKLTEYMVLGIAQDDCRFSVKRGGMIGLNSKDFKSTFVSLNESIYAIMNERGPISVTDMKKYLLVRTNRDILTVTISMIFRESGDYMEIGVGTYDLISRSGERAKRPPDNKIGSLDKVETTCEGQREVSLKSEKGLKEALGVLSKSSPQAVEVERDEHNRFKEYLFIKTKIEEDFVECLKSLKPGEIIFLCGSSGDGKSAILTRYSQKYKDNVRFHLDATHSLDPAHGALKELDKLFGEIADTQKPLVIGINIGMMANYFEGGAEDHLFVRSSMEAFLTNKSPDPKHHFFDFERYPKFKFQDHGARSEFTEKFLTRLTQDGNDNPFFQLLKSHEEANQERMLCVNFRLLCIPAIQRSIVEALMKARLIRDQFMTSRALLDFVYYLLTGSGYLFDNLFTATDNELSQSIAYFDPAIIRTKQIDHFLLEYKLELVNEDFQIFHKSMKDIGIDEVNDPSSFIRFFYLMKGDDFSNNYHDLFKQDFSNSLLEQFAKTWKMHDDYGRSASTEGRKELQSFYNDVLLKGLRRYMNRKAPDLKDKQYFIAENNKVLFAATLKIRADIAALSSSESLPTTTFNARLMVGSQSLPVIPINISLYNLLVKLNEGYRPNKYDKSTVLILDELVDQILDIANKESTLLVYDGSDHYEIEQSDDDFSVVGV